MEKVLNGYLGFPGDYNGPAKPYAMLGLWAVKPMACGTKSLYLGKQLPSRTDSTQLIKHVFACPLCAAWVRKDADYVTKVEEQLKTAEGTFADKSGKKKERQAEAKVAADARVARIKDLCEQQRKGNKRQGLLADLWTPKQKAVLPTS